MTAVTNPPSLQPTRQARGRLSLLIGSLVALVVLTYWPVSGYEFVNWDDPWYVLNNPYLRSWQPSNLVAIATDVIIRNYSPVTIYTYLVEFSFFDTNPTGYHVVNMLLHAMNAVLVFVLISQLSGSRAGGWGTAALFAAHPVHIESVAWVSSMKGLLCGAFILAHLICCLRPERTPKQDVWGLIFFFLALMSKALTVVVPAIVLLYDMLICRKKFSEALARQFVPGMLSVWMLLVTMGAQTTVLGGIRAHWELSKLHIMALDTIILWRYVGMLLCPTDLSVLYNPAVSGIAGQVALACLGWGVVGVLAWRVRRTQPLVILSLAAAFVLLLPVLNLTPITTLMNDRYLYMPSIPFFALLLGLLEAGWRRLSRVDHAWVMLPMTATVALVIASRLHLPVWQNDQALWQHTVSQTPTLPVVRFQYATMLYKQGQRADAIAVLQSALDELNPDAADEDRFRTRINEWTSGVSEDT
jgi:hypothetical protein